MESITGVKSLFLGILIPRIPAASAASMSREPSPINHEADLSMSNSRNSLLDHVRRWFTAFAGGNAAVMRAVVYFVHVRPVLFQFLAHMGVKVVHVFDRVLPFSDPALVGNDDNQITRLVQSTNAVNYTGIENEVFNLYICNNDLHQN